MVSHLCHPLLLVSVFLFYLFSASSALLVACFVNLLLLRVEGSASATCNVEAGWCLSSSFSSFFFFFLIWWLFYMVTCLPWFLKFLPSNGFVSGCRCNIYCSCSWLGKKKIYCSWQVLVDDFALLSIIFPCNWVFVDVVSWQSSCN